MCAIMRVLKFYGPTQVYSPYIPNLAQWLAHAY